MAVVIKPSGPVIGLDIGSTTIKIAEARATREGIQLTGLAVVPTPEELYLQGTIIDPKALGQFIKQLMSSRKMTGKKVVSAISGQSSVVVRIVEMSKMSDQELKDTMKWEVERHVPFAASDVEMDFVPIPNPTAPPDAQTMEVLLVVAQRDAVNLHLEVLQAAGLNPVAIDVAPLAAGRALVDVADPNAHQETIAVVNIGSQTTDINIFRQGTLAFTRPMPLAGETFTRAIADALGKNTEEAEILKQQHATVLLELGSSGIRPLELDAPAPADNPFIPEPQPESEPTVDLSQPLGLLGSVEPPTLAEDDKPSRPAFDLSEDSGPAQAYDLQAPFAYPSEEEPAAEPTEATPESIFDLEAITPPASNVGNGPVIIKPKEEVNELTSLEGLSLPEQIFRAIRPVLDDFVTELKRSLDYFRSRSGGEGISKVILCGGGARIPNLDAYLARELNLIVDIPSLGPSVQCTYNGFTAQDLQEALPLIPTCLGLAIRDMIDEEVPAKQKKSGKAA